MLGCKLGCSQIWKDWSCLGFICRSVCAPKKLFMSWNTWTGRLMLLKPIRELNMKKTVKNVTATWNENATSRKWNRCNCSRVLRSVHCVEHLANVTSFCYFLWFYGYLEHPDSLGIYSSVIQTEALTGCGALFPKQTHLSIEHTYPG